MRSPGQTQKRKKKKRKKRSFIRGRTHPPTFFHSSGGPLLLTASINCRGGLSQYPCTVAYPLSLSLSLIIVSVKKLRMKKASYVVLCAVAVVAMILFEAPLMAKAVTCSPLQLSSCIAAITSSAPPSSTCCTKLREQRPCLCGYLKDPNLRQYVNSPGARKVASTCGVPFPSC